MLTLISGGEMFRDSQRQIATLLIAGSSIAHIGDLDRSALDRSNLPYELLDAGGCLIAPGIIDPHEHLLGGSGEEGFDSRTFEISLEEILTAGITTVVGCLGTDTITRTMEALLAKAKGLRQQGLSAFLWSGGYDVPPVTLTGSVLRDMLLVEEVIGGGEVAISDKRSSAPQAGELAKIVKASYVGGTLTGKAGVTHFHVGEEPTRLEPLRTLLNDYYIEPEWIYPTHINRTPDLTREAAELSRCGVTVDMDTVDLDLHKWLPCFLESNGDTDRLTVSSDAAINSPASIWKELRKVVRQGIVSLQQALSFVTTNTARVLRLPSKGRLQPGCDADLMIVEAGSLEICHVFARGELLLRDGRMTKPEKCMANSNRVIQLYGKNRG